MKLIIVGAGGHGRCCLEIAREIYDEIVFLDDGLVGRIINDCKVIGCNKDMEELYPTYQNIFIAIGNNKVRSILINKAKELGYNIVSLISNRAVISKYACIKEGIVIFPGAIIEPNSTIGIGSIICANSVINHDAYIDDYCLINSSSVIRPTANIKKYCNIGCRCLIESSLEEETVINNGKVVI